MYKPIENGMRYVVLKLYEHNKRQPKYLCHRPKVHCPRPKSHCLSPKFQGSRLSRSLTHISKIPEPLIQVEDL